MKTSPLILYNCVFFLVLFQICWKNAFAQQSYTICLVAGGYENLIAPSRLSGFQFRSNGFNIGIHFNRTLSDNKELVFGVLYNAMNITNYNNQVNVVEINNIPIKLSTSINQKNVEITYLIRKSKNRLSYSYGVILTYLISAKLDQKLVGSYDSSSAPYLHSKFDMSVVNYNAPFSGFNVGPVFGFGFKISEHFFLNNMISMDLISNPRNQFKIEPYNLIKNNILLTFKI